MAGTPILVVDDAPVNLKLIRLLLTHEGYDVRTAERAEEALGMLSSYHPELILADIQLPGMNGLEMTRKVKGNPLTSSIRVVALTACAMKEDREMALRAGCEDYISKPIDTSTLSLKIRELLARPPAPAAVPAPPEPLPPAEATLSFTGPEMESLRRRFLNDGTDRSRQLEASLDSAFDPVTAARQLREWAANATLLGQSEIASLSRKAGELLNEQPLMISRLRDVLTDLFLTFAEQREANTIPLPHYIVQATSNRRIALIGFNNESADIMCSVLERVKARPRLFDAGDDAAAEAIHGCDLAVLHVRPETMESYWLRPDAPVPPPKLLFMGARQDLIALTPAVRSRALDYFSDREEGDDVLMRFAFALSRAADPVLHTTPIAAPAPASTERRRAAVARPSVVMADDDDIVRALVGPTLENYGMRCRLAENGSDGLSMIRSEQPQVAVLDVNMPGMDGYQVLAAVRAEKLPTKVILLSARQQEKDILKAFDLGADDYLTKPFNPFELVARLKRLIG